MYSLALSLLIVTVPDILVKAQTPSSLWTISSFFDMAPECFGISYLSTFQNLTSSLGGGGGAVTG